MMFKKWHNKPYKIIFGDTTYKLVYANSEAEAIKRVNKDGAFISKITELVETHNKSRVGLILELDIEDSERFHLEEESLKGFIVKKYGKDCFDPLSDDNKHENSYTAKQGRKLGGTNTQKNGEDNEQIQDNS